MNIVELAKLKKMVGSSGGGGGATVELDTTLTQAGKAADAKAVGDAIHDIVDNTISASDSTIVIFDSTDGGKSMGVAISTETGNVLLKKADGLFVKDELSSIFGGAVTTIDCGGLMAGTSLTGKTIKDILVMMLGIQESNQPIIKFILANEVPIFNGYVNTSSSPIYQQLDGETALSTDQGFYVTTTGFGDITNAGYQVTFEGEANGEAQTIAIYSEAKIITAYQYQPALGYWLDMGFDGTYWVESGAEVKIVNGEELSYTIYTYNTELLGDPITAPEYWRFEMEVL